MGRTAKLVSIAQLESAADSLARCAESISVARKYMDENKMQQIWMIWSNNTIKLLRSVRSLNKDAVDAVAEERSARLESRENYYADQKLKSQRDAATKRKRDQVAGITPKKRGRPKKKEA